MNITLLSASGLNIYESCPLRFYAKYELKKQSGSTPQVGAGLIAHKILELYYRPDLNMTKEECFEKAIKEECCPDREQFEEAKAMAFALIEEEPKETTNTITTELSFEFYLKSGAGARGFIDRVDLLTDDTIRIVDYKTGAFVPSYEELEEAHQTNLYASYIFLNEKFDDIKKVLFNYKYLRTGQQKAIFITREDSDKYLEYFDHLYHAIKREENPQANINTFCWNCEHRGECVEYKNCMSIMFTIGSACGLGSHKVARVDEVADLSSEEMINVYNALSNMSTCIDKEKKIVGSWLVSMLGKISSGTIETPTATAKLTSRKISYIKASEAKRLVLKHNLVEKALETLKASDVEKIIMGNKEARADYDKVVSKIESTPYPKVTKKA